MSPTLPDVGGGAFNAARLAQIWHQRLAPGVGKRPGYPTNRRWTKHPKLPGSAQTLDSLQEFSVKFISDKRKVSPMQIAGQLLEECVVQVVADTRKRSRRNAT
jgi:hypothetical protein